MIQGSLATPALKLRRMVALSGNWQAAIEHVPRKPEAPDAVWLNAALGVEPRPFAVISPGESHGYDLIAGGDHNYMRARGSLSLFMTVDTPEEYWQDQVQAEFYAASLFGSVMDDVMSISAADDEVSEDGTSHLSIISADMQLFGETSKEDWNSLGRFYFCAYAIMWGDGGGS
jgi:hypothetical protein